MAEADDQPRPANPLVPGLALLGSALLVGGAFCPIVVLSSGEARSYRDFAWADGNVVLGAAAVAFVLTWVFRWYRGLFVAGGVALFMIGATLLKVPRAGLAGVALSWGWLPLVAGAVLLVTAALLAEKGRPREEPQDEPPDEETPLED
jgi:hypothetical protein